VDKNSSGQFMHKLCYELRWSSGWSSMIPSQYNPDNLIERHGPFDSRTEQLSFFAQNRATFPGGSNARLIDLADRFDCADQT
jgi:hypothetical protein